MKQRSSNIEQEATLDSLIIQSYHLERASGLQHDCGSTNGLWHSPWIEETVKNSGRSRRLELVGQSPRERRITQTAQRASQGCPQIFQWALIIIITLQKYEARNKPSESSSSAKISDKLVKHIAQECAWRKVRRYSSRDWEGLAKIAQVKEDEPMKKNKT